MEILKDNSEMTLKIAHPTLLIDTRIAQANLQKMVSKAQTHHLEACPALQNTSVS